MLSRIYYVIYLINNVGDSFDRDIKSARFEKIINQLASHVESLICVCKQLYSPEFYISGNISVFSS